MNQSSTTKNRSSSDQELSGKRVAILATDGFEQSELMDPKQALIDAGAEVSVVSLKSGEIKGWKHTDWGETVKVDVLLDDADAEHFDALMLPGGVINPDKLRMERKAVEFVKAFADAGKPIAAICHGPQTLIETGMVIGRTLTSWPSLKTDLINAGANWVDEEVVTDHGLVTSRKPADIPAFNRKMIEEFAEGVHSVRQSFQASRAKTDERVPRH
jgi:protease I